MSFEHDYDLNMDAGSVPFVIEKSLGDSDFTLGFYPYSKKGTLNLGTTSSYGYYLEGTLPDGTKVSLGGSASNTSKGRRLQFTVNDDRFTCQPGEVPLQVKFVTTSNSRELRSSKFILRVEARKPLFWV